MFRLRTEERLSFRQIVQALAEGVPGPRGSTIVIEVGVSTVRSDYWGVMQRDGYVRDPASVELHRAEQLEQLDRLKAAIEPGAFDGDARAVSAYLRIIDHEAKLVGTYPTPGAANDGPNPAVLLSSAILTKLLEVDPEFRSDVAAGLRDRVMARRAQALGGLHGG